MPGGDQGKGKNCFFLCFKKTQETGKDVANAVLPVVAKGLKIGLSKETRQYLLGLLADKVTEGNRDILNQTGFTGILLEQIAVTAIMRENPAATPEAINALIKEKIKNLDLDVLIDKFLQLALDAINKPTEDNMVPVLLEEREGGGQPLLPPPSSN